MNDQKAIEMFRKLTSQQKEDAKYLHEKVDQMFGDAMKRFDKEVIDSVLMNMGESIRLHFKV